MFRSANIFVYAIFAFNIYGGLSEMTESPEIANLENLLEDGIRKCGESCYSTLKPLADHITTSEQRWSSCISRNVNDAHNKIKSQLAALQEKLAINSILSSSVEFQQIGGRYFYIAENETVKLFSASNTCRRLGGHLAIIEDEEEMRAISAKLKPDSNYWLGINDLAVEGEFRSLVSGQPVSYLKWAEGQPSDAEGTKDGVSLKNGLMYSEDLATKYHFICQPGSS